MNNESGDIAGHDHSLQHPEKRQGQARYRRRLLSDHEDHTGVDAGNPSFSMDVDMRFGKQPRNERTCLRNWAHIAGSPSNPPRTEARTFETTTDEMTETASQRHLSVRKREGAHKSLRVVQAQLQHPRICLPHGIAGAQQDTKPVTTKVENGDKKAMQRAGRINAGDRRGWR